MTFSLPRGIKELTKKYHINPAVSNKKASDIQSQESMNQSMNQWSTTSSLINESKDRYIAKMSAKLDNTKSVPKIYWSIINKCLSNKKIHHLFLLTVNWYQILNKKLISSTIVLLLYVLISKMVANYRTLVNVTLN